MTHQRKPPVNLIKGRRRTARSELEDISQEVLDFLENAETRNDHQTLLDEMEEKGKDLLSAIQSFLELNEEYLNLIGEDLPDDTDSQEFQDWETESKESSKFLRTSKAVASKVEVKRKKLNCQIQSEQENKEKQEKTEKDEIDRQLKSEMEKLSLENQKEIEFEKIRNGLTGAPQRFKSGQNHCKLPKVEITKFDGNKLEFRKFWGKFKNSVDSQDMPQVQKLTYLLEFMKPGSEAYRALEGIEVIDSNYELACKILKDRFGEEQAIKNMHYKELLKVTCAGGKTADLRAFFDTVEKHVRPLQLMEFDCNNGMFLSLLQSKLPEFVSLKMLETNRNEEIKDFDTFQTLLGQIIKSRETVSENYEKPANSYTGSFVKETIREKPGFQKPKFTQYLGPNRYSKQHTTTGALIGATVRKEPGMQKPETPTCFCCGGYHFLDQCEKYPDVDSIKRKLAEMKDVCHRCFRSGHRTQECFVKKPCFYCKRTDHHNALCPERGKKQQDSKPNGRNGSGTINCHVADTTKSRRQVLFPTAEVLVRKPGSSNGVKSRVLLDSACNQTFMTNDFAKKLGIKITEPGTATAVFVFSQKKAKDLVDKEGEVEMQLKNGNWKKLSIKVVPHITNKISKAPKELWDALKEWNDLEFAEPIMEDLEATPMDLLIGGDYYGQIFQGGKIEVTEKISLHKSSLGWIPMGQVKVQSDQEEQNKSYFFNMEQKDQDLQFSTFTNQQIPELKRANGLEQGEQNLTVCPNMEDMWSLETIGIMDSPYVSDDEKAMQFFNKTVVFENNRYQTKWPYKNENPELPENIGMAKGQLRSLWNRNQENLEILEKIDDILKDQLEKGIVEVVENGMPEGPMKHYVPFHAVVTPSNQTTKTRLVYNASAKQKGKCSLNECLYRGPPVIADLCGMLLRFRLDKVAMIADVEKAFLQVGLQIPDRDVTRFFWLKDYKKAPTEQNLLIYRFARVPFGVVSSPFLLMATIFHHLDKDGSLEAQKIKRNIYMDNVIVGVDSTETGKKFYQKAKDLFSTASMNLREWGSNDIELLKSIHEKDKVTGDNVKVLGLRWDRTADELHISGKPNMFDKDVQTKRNLLKEMARIFDPLGFFLPVTVRFRFLWRTICMKDKKWDEKLEEQFLHKWKELANDIPNIFQFRVHRWLGHSKEAKSCELICFTDASGVAYSTVVYLRMETDSGTKCQLIFAKSRLSPLKTISIPRLELMGVLIGTEALKFVEKELGIHIEERMLFTDSKCVLNWIKSSGKWTTFVENRVRKIQENTTGKKFSFRFVSTSENPADLSTRGMPANSLAESGWWEGPSWLKNRKINWPDYDQEEVTQETWEKVEAESKKNSMMYSATSSLMVVKKLDSKVNENEDTPFGMNLEKYGTLNKLLRITAICLRAWKRFKGYKPEIKTIRAKDLECAKVVWEKHIQEKYFSEERRLLKEGKKNNLIRSLGLRMDDKIDLIRVYGRMENMQCDQGAKHPKLLPRKSKFTGLVIRHVHKLLLHSGTTHTLSVLRQEYWICQGRIEVKVVLKGCVICKKNHGGPYQVPPMPHFPEFRVKRSIPFTHVGLDYMGPLMVKIDEIGEKRKVWISLFTCLTVRAIHLEIVRDLSSEQFLQALRRFISRRGQPERIISDNAAQFKVAEKTLKLTIKPLEPDAANNGIKWQFITELAPWMGGFYERLVALVKNSLKKAIGRNCLNLKQLETFVTEVEATVNSRPIVPIGDEVEHRLSLTPVDFLGCRKLGAPRLMESNEESDPEYTENLSTKEKLIKTWKVEQKVLDSFWHIWETQYLDSLRERRITDLNQKRNTQKENPMIGDVVLIKQEKMPRGCWKIGRITEVKTSGDSEVRVAKVKLANGTTIQRSIKQLYPVECASTGKDNSEGFQPTKKDEEIKCVNRPMRQAAIKARKRIQELN